VPLLLNLLDHPNHWVRINATKALIFMDAREAVPTLAQKLAESPPEADYGFFAERLHDTWQVGQDEFNDPAPRYREAYIMALGKLGASDHVPLLIDILFDERNVLECRYAAAHALDRLGTPGRGGGVAAGRGQSRFPHRARGGSRSDLETRSGASDRSEARFVQSGHFPPGPDLTPPGRSPSGLRPDSCSFRAITIRTTRSGPTTGGRPTTPPTRDPCIVPAGTWPSWTSAASRRVFPLTDFPDGYVADANVSYDGQRVIFARREQHDPWWHLCEIDRWHQFRQITRGPYHHVSPNYLPDGRIVFSTTRLGTRDEYHGYPCTGLAVMRPDGSDMQFIGFNLGRDADTVIGPDGNLLFARLEIFYGRLESRMEPVERPAGRHAGHDAVRSRTARVVEQDRWRLYGLGDFRAAASRAAALPASTVRSGPLRAELAGRSDRDRRPLAARRSPAGHDLGHHHALPAG
jgi:hypothetical protein